MQSAIKISAKQLQKLEGSYLSFHSGDLESSATGVGTPEKLTNSQLAFVGDPAFLPLALEKASLLIVDKKLANYGLTLQKGQALWTTPALKAAMVLVLPLFDPRKHGQEPLLSPQASIHPTAHIGARTRVAAGARIGAHVQIGEDCLIQANAVIEDFCQIGNRCHIHPNAVIGADGFGFATDSHGHHHKIPQIGMTVLEDDVEIGAGTTVDRATLGETRIGQGTKFDKQCHVAHNCKVGKHNVFAGGTMVAGSTIIGDHCTMGGAVIITDHVEITNRVQLGGLSAVTKNITKSGAYTGYPLEPLRDALRTLQNLTHLTEMRRQLQHISKRLGLAEESE